MGCNVYFVFYSCEGTCSTIFKIGCTVLACEACDIEKHHLRVQHGMERLQNMILVVFEARLKIQCCLTFFNFCGRRRRTGGPEVAAAEAVAAEALAAAATAAKIENISSCLWGRTVAYSSRSTEFYK